MIVIGDIHGCAKTLEALLNKLPDDKICCVGDYIDRGPRPKEVIDLLIKHDIDCVMGNHEDMLLKAVEAVRRGKIADYEIHHTWVQNGGGTTLKSYKAMLPVGIETSHLIWISTLPKCRVYDDIVDKDDRKLFVSHAGLSALNFNIVDAIEKDDILWHRDKIYVPRGLFSVVGHIPVASHCVYYDVSDWINIDTGCVFKWKQGMGVLTAFQYPQMEVFQQDNID